MKFILLISILYTIETIGAQWKPFGLDRCIVSNEEYFQLIDWYIGRSKEITVAVIEDAATDTIISYFGSNFLREFMKRDSHLVYVTTHDVDNESEIIGESDRYSWQGELIVPRNKIVRVKRQSSPKTSPSTSTLRNDEPQAGTLVVVTNITVIDDYLVGTGRSPFRTPRSHYILILRYIFKGWKEHVDRVLRKLWHVYGIVNVLVIAPCLDYGEDVVATYFPYAVNVSMENPVANDFGAIEWTGISDMDYSMRLLRKLRQMNGFPFPVSIFNRYPTALQASDMSDIVQRSYFNRAMKFSGGFGGFDGMVLGNIAEKMRFRTVVVSPKLSDFGWVDRNGSSFGSMGDVLYRQAYMSMNGRFVADYGSNEVDFMYPVNFDNFCIIAPKALRIPQWIAIFKCFSVNVWIAIVVSSFACGGIWWKLRSMSKGKSNKVADSFLYVLLESWLILLSAPSIYLPKRNLIRIFMTGWLLGGVIIIGSFQGTLTTSYSTTTYYKDINSLQDLDDSGLPLGTTSNSLIGIFGTGDSPLLKSLISKFYLLSGATATIDRTAYDRDICCIERCADIKVIIAGRYELPNGRSMLHSIPESPRYLQIAYMVKKGWPWMTGFNNLIHRFNEAGLLNKWYQETQDSIITHERISRRNYIEAIRVLSLTDLQTAFFILGLGHVIGLLCFIYEISICSKLFKKCVKKYRNALSF